jgi:short-chain fatty acids transporter
VPTILIVVLMGFLFVRMYPPADRVVPFSTAATDATVATDKAPVDDSTRKGSIAAFFEHSRLGLIGLLAPGVGYLVWSWHSGEFRLDLNTTILIFMLVGLTLQGTPMAYADAIRRAARHTGTMVIQYPVYGGIMGIMTASGLAALIAEKFVAISSPTSLPLWSFISSLIITWRIQT